MTAQPPPTGNEPTVDYGAPVHGAEPGEGGGTGREAGDGSGAGYPDAPEGLRWVPILGGRGLLTAVVAAGAVAALGAFALITWLFVADGLEFHEQMSLAVLAVGLVVLGIGLPLLVGEGARLELAPTPEVEAGVRGFGPAPEAVEAVVKMMKGLTATRVAAAAGVLLIMTGAFLARPADEGAGDDEQTSQVEQREAAAAGPGRADGPDKAKGNSKSQGGKSDKGQAKGDKGKDKAPGRGNGQGNKP